MVELFPKVANVSNSFEVALPPSVVFSILELYQRRLEDQSRVLGLLVGSWSDDGMQVSIEDCFPIPFVDMISETGNTIEVIITY